jgi:putative PIN family toxin of toxin-antitoxin system
MIRVVLDTNVLVSGFAKWRDARTAPPRILRLWDSGAFELGVSTSILRELEFALSKSFFEIHSDPVVSRMLLDRIKTDAVHVDHPAPTPGIATHWQDDLILATAVEFQADYLVTGDKELLALDHPFAFQIIHPNAFLAILEGDETLE